MTPSTSTRSKSTSSTLSLPSQNAHLAAIARMFQELADEPTSLVFETYISVGCTEHQLESSTYSTDMRFMTCHVLIHSHFFACIKRFEFHVEGGPLSVINVKTFLTCTITNASMSMDTFQLYNLRVEVIWPEGEIIMFGATPGDHLVLQGEMLHLPEPDAKRNNIESKVETGSDLMFLWFVFPTFS